jgi:hypothetical protein
MVCLLTILVNCFFDPQAAFATVCDRRNDQSICVDRIQRSAKNYWEYRVRLTVNGIVQPTVFYDCRRRQKSQANGIWVDLVEDRVDRLACSLWHPN